jgi:DtxR family transcriptional regulator, Mn-dependent transcriptional regulator
MSGQSPSPRLSIAIGDYLKAIWSLARGEGGTVATSAIAERLGVSPASVSGMIVRLQERGWVTHERYRGVRLTRSGDREALRLVRRHRLIETFLIEYLGYAWDEVHDEAEALEHAISDRFTERLAARLGHPSHDPHGDPIPTPRGGLPATPDAPLDAVEVGGTLRVSRLRTQAPEALAHLDRAQIRPGVDVRVLARSGDGVRVRVDGGEHTLPSELARMVRGALVLTGPGDRHAGGDR